MATQTPETPAPSAPAKKRNLVPILIVVGVIVLVIIGVGVWKLTSKSDTTKDGKPPGALSKQLFKAWQSGDQAAAAKVATPTAVTAIFKLPASEGSGLKFGGCAKQSDDSPFPKTCVFSRPGGQLTLTVNRVKGDKTVTNVALGAAGTTPTSSG